MPPVAPALSEPAAPTFATPPLAVALVELDEQLAGSAVAKPSKPIAANNRGERSMPQAYLKSRALKFATRHVRSIGFAVIIPPRSAITAKLIPTLVDVAT